jgi:hypothetical protein
MKRQFENIINKLPCNIAPEYTALYTAKSQYNSPILHVRDYSNVFVSHEGLCWKNFHLLPYSTFNINSSYDAKHGWEFFRLVTEQYLVSTFGKSLKKITLPANKQYAVIHTKWFNYSFWMTSSLVRLRMLYKQTNDFTLIYPEEWDNIAYIQETLRAFPNLKIEKIPAGVHVQVPHLLLPEVRPFTACLNGDDIKDVSLFIQHFFEKDLAAISTTPKKIFVNRKKASCRKIVNSDAVEQVLKKYGYEEIDFDDLSFVEQMAYMQNARFVVMLHGAGMVNVMFARSQTKILELMHEYTEPRTYRFIYWFLTVQMQCDYYVQFCKTINNHSDEWRKDIEVDVTLLEQNLNLMLQEHE